MSCSEADQSGRFTNASSMHVCRICSEKGPSNRRTAAIRSGSVSSSTFRRMMSRAWCSSGFGKSLVKLSTMRCNGSFDISLIASANLMEGLLRPLDSRPTQAESGLAVKPRSVGLFFGCFGAGDLRRAEWSGWVSQDSQRHSSPSRSSPA